MLTVHPVEVNNTVIYLVSRPLAPPVDALETALPEMDFSIFVAGVFSTNLADLLKTTPKTTLLIPPNDAFKRLGLLVSNHLLSSSSKADSASTGSSGVALLSLSLSTAFLRPLDTLLLRAGAVSV